jgi:hypothetical protein
MTELTPKFFHIHKNREFLEFPNNCLLFNNVLFHGVCYIFYPNFILHHKLQQSLLFLNLIFTVYQTKGTRKIDIRSLCIDPWKMPDVYLEVNILPSPLATHFYGLVINVT